MVTSSPPAQIVDGLGLPAGALGRAGLERVVAAFAARPDLWAPHRDPAATTRTFAELHRDDRLDVWALFWVAEADTGWHDHDGSDGAVAVLDGTLTEHALVLGGPDRRRRYPRAQTFSFGPAHIHRVTCDAGRAASIHAYSPPLRRLGQYDVTADGVLRRQAVDYLEELRPSRSR